MYTFTAEQTLKYVEVVLFFLINRLFICFFFLLCPYKFFLKVAYQNDGEAALIQFASPDEAKRAIQSTEAVLNNRFIRVHWFREDGNDGQVHPHSQLQPRTQPATVIIILFGLGLQFF